MIADLLLYSGAVYGIAWLIAKSALLAPLRSRIRTIRAVGEHIDCIVCVGTWVGIAVLALLPETTLLDLRGRTAADVVVLLGWTVFFLWVIARATGDAT